MKNINGKIIYNWAKDLFPMHRSITGKGLLDTLKYIKRINPKLKIYKVKSGTRIFDWIIPKEWEIKEAYIQELNGKKILDYKNNNLHVIGYSSPIDKIINCNLLKKKIYTIPSQKNAIPYLTSYYKKNWGFCMSENQKKKLNKKKKYKILIDSKFKPGNLYFGEIFIKGKTEKEIIFSCNVCHPSLANNELSGPVISIAISEYLKSLKSFYSYRILFIPETIGALCFLKKNKKNLKKIKGGFVLSCLGDPGKYFTLINSRYANNYADEKAEKNFKLKKYKYKKYSYLKRGSDERQYCAPNFNLPFCTITKTRFGDFKEYHTSLDNLDFITHKSLSLSFKMIKNLINLIEEDKKERFFLTKINGEPFMSKYNLKKTLSGYNNSKFYKKSNVLMNVFSYCDGKNSLTKISKLINVNYKLVLKAAIVLKKFKILKEIDVK